jgi:hypothetical protein
MYDNAYRVESNDHAGKQAITRIKLQGVGEVVATYPSADGQRTIYALALPAAVWLLLDVRNDFEDWVTARYHSEGEWRGDKQEAKKQALMIGATS